MSNYDNWKTSQPTDKAADYANSALDRMTMERMVEYAELWDLIPEDSIYFKMNELEELLFDHLVEEYYENF